MRTPLIAACATAAALACAGSASAAEYTPTTFDDSLSGIDKADCPPDAVAPDCSVREALAAARDHAGDDTVTLSEGRYVLKGSLSIDGEGKVTLRGVGPRGTTIDADSDQESPGRALVIRAETSAEISDLAITGAYSDGDGLLDGAAVLVEQDEQARATGVLKRVHIHRNTSEGSGGAISNQGTLTIDSSLIERNTAQIAGGAIENWGKLTVTNSTFSGNQTLNSFNPEGSVGGAIDNQQFNPDTSFTLESSTVTDNTAAYRGGGIVTSNEIPTTVRNSIVAGNHVPDGDGEDYPNCLGTPTSGGHNLEDGTSCGFSATGDLNADPKLAPVADNGGPTNTRALLAGSPANDAGSTAGCPALDQRGFTRPVGAACDIGAFELGSAPPRQEPGHPGQGNQQEQKPHDQIAADPEPRIDDHRQVPRDCRDADKPLTTLKRSGVKAGPKGVTLAGRSSDAKGECASGVDRVQVSLAKVSGTELNCRFVKKPNRFVLTPFRNCRKPVMFRAAGTSKWGFTFRVKLAPGKYRAQARGFDRARNKETPTKRRNIVYFTVR
jgi:predicted outer membrane repeat protein